MPSISKMGVRQEFERSSEIKDVDARVYGEEDFEGLFENGSHVGGNKPLSVTDRMVIACKQSKNVIVQFKKKSDG